MLATLVRKIELILFSTKLFSEKQSKMVCELCSRWLIHLFKAFEGLLCVSYFYGTADTGMNKSSRAPDRSVRRKTCPKYVSALKELRDSRVRATITLGQRSTEGCPACQGHLNTGPQKHQWVSVHLRGAQWSQWGLKSGVHENVLISSKGRRNKLTFRLKNLS